MLCITFVHPNHIAEYRKSLIFNVAHKSINGMMPRVNSHMPFLITFTARTFPDFVYNGYSYNQKDDERNNISNEILIH